MNEKTIIMNEYLIKSKKLGADLRVKYRNGIISYFNIEGELPVAIHEKLLNYIPLTENDLETFRKQPTVEVNEVQVDLSFKAFWYRYNYKVKKQRAVKAWEKLSKTKRIKAMLFIQKLRNWSQRKGIDMPYPVTYIHQERWEDELNG